MEEFSEMKKKNAETSDKRKIRGICYFLLSLLEDKKYEHVQWTNKEKGEFQIHWVHASSGAWEMDTDAETFRLWAKVKGKLEGRENKNKTWKANFRCAMKSRPELEEIKLPKNSPQRKKNVKFWKFVDISIVKEYRDGRSFDWRHSRRKSLTKKAPRERPLSPQNITAAETRDETETLNSLPISRTFPLDETQTMDDAEEEEDSNRGSYGAGLLQLIDRHVENRDDGGENMPFEGRLKIDMDDDSEFSPYGAGLVKIIERNEEDNKSAVLNIPATPYAGSFAVCSDFRQKENTVFFPSSQQTLFHQTQSAFCGEQTFPDAKVATGNWELFMDEHLEETLKEEGMATNHLETCNVEDAYDIFPWLFNIYS